MSRELMIATDLDRTLIPNGPQPESPGARERFSALVARPEVTLVYVTGRHRVLVEQAMESYDLPGPDFVVGDVGTTIYRLDAQQEWQRQEDWEAEIAADWCGRQRADLAELLHGLPDMRPQEPEKQNRYKLSYYLPPDIDEVVLAGRIRSRLEPAGVKARVVFSVDETADIGLLDVLPERASKLHALQALMKSQGFGLEQVVFCGDSGNDLEVLASPVPSVLVANSRPEVRQRAREMARVNACEDALYIAAGGFMGMNGHYSAGILEGIAHYHPEAVHWMGFAQSEPP